MCKEELIGSLCAEFVQDSEEYRDMAHNWALTFQPATAFFGLVGCFMIFAFASALWWDTPPSAIKVFSAFGAVGRLASCLMISLANWVCSTW